MPHANEMLPEALLSKVKSEDSESDAAVGRVSVPADEVLAVAIDTLVSGVHFRTEAKATDVAYKSVAVNLSDLAAMGAIPIAVAVALSTETPSGSWMEGFRRGLAAAAQAFEIEVVAAGISRGHLTVSVEAIGRVPADAVLTRDGARAGDRIYVTGTLGDAGLGLAVAKGEILLPADDSRYVLNRLDRPQPRLAAGVALRGLASSVIDLSDGLAGDLNHILNRSGVGARVNADQIPLSPVMNACRESDSALKLALGFGDDYELCFTLPEAAVSALEKRKAQLGCPVTEVGVIEAQPGLRFSRDDGHQFQAPAAYDHFRD